MKKRAQYGSHVGCKLFSFRMVNGCLNGLVQKSVASFPGCSHLQNLIACSMQIRRGKTWEIWSRAVTSGRQRVRHTKGGAQQRILNPFLVLSIREMEARALARQCHSSFTKPGMFRHEPGIITIGHRPLCLSSVYLT